MFVATLNKTLKSYIFAIVGAEYILRWLPIGTHEWEKFLRPEELISIQKENNLPFFRLDFYVKITRVHLPSEFESKWNALT